MSLSLPAAPQDKGNSCYPGSWPARCQPVADQAALPGTSGGRDFHQSYFYGPPGLSGRGSCPTPPGLSCLDELWGSIWSNPSCAERGRGAQRERGTPQAARDGHPPQGGHKVISGVCVGNGCSDGWASGGSGCPSSRLRGT